MTRWAAFLGLTGVILTLFLGLARLSQGAVRDSPPETALSEDNPENGDRAGDSPDAGGPLDPDRGSEPGPDRTTDPGAVADDHGTSNPEQDDDPSEAWDGPSEAWDGPSETWDGPSEAWDDPPGVADGTPSLSTGALLANVAVTQGLFGGVLALGAFYFAVPPSALGIGGENLTLLAIGIGLGAVLWVSNELAAALAGVAGVASDETLREMLSPESTLGWAVLFGLVLPVVAVVEELIFRAAVVGVPAAGFGTPVWALVPVSAGAFALGHGAQGRVGVAVTGGLGLVLAGAYAVTGSLLVVVVAHYLVNALEFLVHELLDRPRLWAS